MWKKALIKRLVINILTLVRAKHTFFFSADLLYVQSAGSEMDALHNAYRQMNTGEDSDDLKLHRLSLEWNESNNNPIALSSKRQQAAKSPECASTNESGIVLWTVLCLTEELWCNDCIPDRWKVDLILNSI